MLELLVGEAWNLVTNAYEAADDSAGIRVVNGDQCDARDLGWV